MLICSYNIKHTNNNIRLIIQTATGGATPTTSPPNAIIHKHPPATQQARLALLTPWCSIFSGGPAHLSGASGDKKKEKEKKEKKRKRCAHLSGASGDNIYIYIYIYKHIYIYI